MLSQATCSSTCHITSYDKVSISTADTTRALRCNFTWTHEADTAAYASNTESTLWLLFVETIKHCITTDLLHAKNHFTYRRIWCLFNYILFCRPCFTILSNGFHVIVYAMFMRYPWFMSVWHPFIRRHSLCMIMVMTMFMIVVMMMIVVVMMIMVVTMMVMMTATMAMMVMMMVMMMFMMMFTMAMVMGIFIFHVFTHNKPPRGLRRPADNNKKTYSTFILFFKSTILVGFKSYLLNMF